MSQDGKDRAQRARYRDGRGQPGASPQRQGRQPTSGQAQGFADADERTEIRDDLNEVVAQIAASAGFADEERTELHEIGALAGGGLDERTEIQEDVPDTIREQQRQLRERRRARQQKRQRAQQPQPSARQQQRPRGTGQQPQQRPHPQQRQGQRPQPQRQSQPQRDPHTHFRTGSAAAPHGPNERAPASRMTGAQPAVRGGAEDAQRRSGQFGAVHHTGGHAPVRHTGEHAPVHRTSGYAAVEGPGPHQRRQGPSQAGRHPQPQPRRQQPLERADDSPSAHLRRPNASGQHSAIGREVPSSTSGYHPTLERDPAPSGQHPSVARAPAPQPEASAAPRAAASRAEPEPERPRTGSGYFPSLEEISAEASKEAASLEEMPFGFDPLAQIKSSTSLEDPTPEDEEAPVQLVYRRWPAGGPIPTEMRVSYGVWGAGAGALLGGGLAAAVALAQQAALFSDLLGLLVGAALGLGLLAGIGCAAAPRPVEALLLQTGMLPDDP